MGREFPKLFVITDWSLPDLPARIESVCSLGPSVAILHRHPDATARVYLDEARVLASLCARASMPLFVHGRLDVAVLVGAHLHLPSSGLRPADVRAHLPGRWVSAAVHDETEATAAAGADLMLLSPVFAPHSKSADRAPLGVDGFARLASRVRAHPVALGGIDAERARLLSPTVSLAAIGSVLHAKDPRAAAAVLLATRA